MSLTEVQKNKAFSVINVFETGKKTGGYGNVTILKDGSFLRKDKKMVTFGSLQCTEEGNLKRLLTMYVQNGGEYAEYFKSKLPIIGKVSLVTDKVFIAALKASGDDPIMQRTQDEFFDIVYGSKAYEFFDKNGFTLPLSYLVIFDSIIHSGQIFSFLRNRFKEVPPAQGGNEKVWITEYVKARRKWWLNHAHNPHKGIIGKGTYRADCFLDAIQKDNWNLDVPINANGTII